MYHRRPLADPLSMRTDHRAPRLSVGLPVYNGEKYIRQSIDSLLGQTYEDFELVISDNASTDGTADICQQYAQQDSRIRYLRQPRNIGLAPNHNYVFAQSRGELFKWAAADDLYGRDLFKLCIEALDAHPEVVLAHAWEAAIDADSHLYQSLEYPLATGSPSAPERFRSILFGSSGLFESPDPAVSGLVRVDNRGILRSCDQYGVIRSDVLRRVAPLDSYHHSDRILTVELALHGPFHITPQWLYFRRDYPDRTYNQSPNVRDRCAILDPARAGALRNPTARLVAEYFHGYYAAIKRAPLATADRRACYRQLGHWMLDRAACAVAPEHFARTEVKLSGDLVDARVSVQASVAGQEQQT
jgi:glycosyltransferase involved in cell wall biosynthesis